MPYPVPQKIKYKTGEFLLEKGFCFLFEYKGNNEIFKIVKTFCEKYKKITNEECYPVADYAGKLKPAVKMKADDALSDEEYKIKIDKNGILITYKAPVGAFRAITTFLQLIRENGKRLKYVDIHDFPDIKRRGFMLDISRNRVPKMSEIFKLIDFLAELKYNEFQLYLENHSFEYCAYPEYTKDIEGLTPFEVMQIVEYCRERYIDVVPNQNSFGHLYEWVQKPELRELELAPGDFSINPLDPRSFELLNNIYDSLLPCFTSEFFNVGCDEVAGLSESEKIKEAREKDGVATIYINHLLNLRKMLKERKKRMLFWADIIFNHPDRIPELPKDMVPLVWGYEADTDFDKPGKMLKEAGLDFYFCPGTASWAACLGDNEKARLNILHSAQYCKKHDGLGVLLTDWGDGGHVQFFVISYMALAFCGGVCWNVKGNTDFELAKEYVDKFVFEMKYGSFCDVLFRASQVIPKNGNCTDAFLSILLPFDNYTLCEKTKYERLFEAKKEYDALEKEARCLTMGCEEAAQYVDEFCCNVEIYKILIDLLAFKYEKRDNGKIKNLKKRLDAIEQHIKEIKVFYKRLWSTRDYLTGCDVFWGHVESHINKLKEFCKDDLK